MTPTTTLTDMEVIDAEHQVQISLLDSLLKAAEDDDADGKELLEQLFAYTNIHFMSEQVLMRQYSYPDYDVHVAEHDGMMAQLDLLQEAMAAQRTDVATLGELRRLLVTHIATHDQQLHSFIAASTKHRA
jgi:hemerythrin